LRCVTNAEKTVMTTAKYLATMAQSALRNPNGFQSFLRVIAAYGLIQGMTSSHLRYCQ
jgi:predicted DNA-binding ribbon-helix-helix protein